MNLLYVCIDKVYSLGKGSVWRLDLNGSREGFCGRGRGKVIPCRWTEDRKGARTNSGESDARNLEAESIRSRAESTGGCVKLKTVTEIDNNNDDDDDGEEEEEVVVVVVVVVAVAVVVVVVVVVVVEEEEEEEEEEEYQRFLGMFV